MSSSENTGVEKKAMLVQVNLYKQMREHLLAKLKIYQLQNKVELAKIILNLYDTNYTNTIDYKTNSRLQVQVRC